MSYDYGTKAPLPGFDVGSSSSATHTKINSREAKVDHAGRSAVANSVCETGVSRQRAVVLIDPKEVSSAVQQRELRAIDRAMKTATDCYVMQPLGSSANPVTRLRDEQFIPASSLACKAKPQAQTAPTGNTATDRLGAFGKTALSHASELKPHLQKYVASMADAIQNKTHEMFESYFQDSGRTASELHEELETMDWEQLMPEASEANLSKEDSKALKKFLASVVEEYPSVSVSSTAAPAGNTASDGLQAFGKTALSHTSELKPHLQKYVASMADAIQNKTHEMFESYFQDSGRTASELHEELETMDWEQLMPEASEANLSREDSKALKNFLAGVVKEYQSTSVDTQAAPSTVKRDITPHADISMAEFNKQVRSVVIKMSGEQPSHLKPAFERAASPILKYMREAEAHMKERGKEGEPAADYKKVLVENLAAAIDNPELSSEVKDLLKIWKNEIEKMATSVELKGVPLRFDKEGVLSNARMMQGEQIPALLKGIQNLPQRYISSEDLERIAEKLGVSPSSLQRNLEPFYSTFELEAASNFSAPMRQVIKTKMESLTAAQVGGSQSQSTSDRPGYAFKLGVENHREILAGKVVSALGLADFYTSKIEQIFSSASLTGVQAPSGIASKWLEDATLLSRKATATMFALNAVANAPTQWPAGESRDQLTERFVKFCGVIPTTFEGWLNEAKTTKSPEAIKKLQLLQMGILELERKGISADPIINDILKEARKVFPSELKGMPVIQDAELHQLLADGWYDTYSHFIGPYEGTVYSAQALALSDALMLTNDGHEEQYMFMQSGGQTHIECIDQARHLSPSEAYTKEGQTYIAIRSTWLDSPTLDEPIPAKLLETANKLDPHKAGEELRAAGVVVPDEKLAQARQEREEIRQQLDQIDNNRMTSAEADKLCAMYSIRGPGDRLQALHRRLEGEITIRTTYMYQHISEKSLAAFQGRIQRVKEYLASNDNPKTMRGVVRQTLPQVSIIAEAMAKLTNRPFLGINIRPTKEGSLQTHSLEATIKELEALQPPLSEEELAKVRTAAAELNAQAVELGEVLQCMNAA